MTWTSHPLFGVSVTLAAYCASLSLYRVSRLLNPLLTASLIVIALLFVARIPMDDYQAGGQYVTILLEPATVALGVPFYKNFKRIRKHLAAILSGVTVGALSGIVSSGFLVWAMGGPREILLAMLPKTITTPIAVGVVKQLGGSPELGAVFTILTAVLGSVIGVKLLQIARVRSDITIGTAIGTSSNGAGTSRLLMESELQGSISGFAMSLTGVVGSILMIPVYGWLT